MVAKGRILIVDDEPDTIRLIKTLLKNEGYEVISAGNGEEGLIKANRENPDIVLIDIRLPGMDGNKLLKRIKENNPQQSVIMITAYADVDNAITSLKFGADDFIRKPFDNAHLLHIINKSFENRVLMKEKEELRRKYEKLVKGKHMGKKEALVLYGITRYPELSDKEVSKKIGIPRTTLTGIKNKLKRCGAFRNVNLPNFTALGFELLSVISFELNPSISHSRSLDKDFVILKKKGVIYSQITDLEGFLLCVFGDFTEYKRDIEPHLNELVYGNYFKRLFIHHFPLKLSEIIRFMDFSPLVRRLFDIEGSSGVDERLSVNEKKKISKTEKTLIRALVNYPEFSDVEIAGKVSLSRARVSQIKRKLIDGGIVKARVFPDLSNLEVNLLSVMSVGLNPKCTQGERKNLIGNIRLESSVVFSIISDTELLTVNIMKDYDHYKEVYDSIEEIGREGNCITAEMKTILLPVENIRSTKIDFASLLENI